MAVTTRFTVLVVFFAAVSKQAVKGASSPNRSPVPNLDAALHGYNLMEADPFSRENYQDPGWKRRIMHGTKHDKYGNVKEADNIWTTTNVICHGWVWINGITTLKEYKNRQLRSICNSWIDFIQVEIGNDLEVEVSAEVNVGRRMMVSTKIPPFFKSSSRATEPESKLRNFFSSESGSIVAVTKECIVQQVGILPGVVPAFTDDFKETIQIMWEAAKLNKTDKSKHAFKNFVLKFGTHYSKQTIMGAKMIFQMRLDGKEKIEISKEGAEQCSKSQIPFFLTEKDEQNKCDEDRKFRSKLNSKNLQRIKLVTYGPLPRKKHV